MIYLAGVQLEFSGEGKVGDVSRGCTVRSIRGGEVGWVIYLGGVQLEVSGEGKLGG